MISLYVVSYWAFLALWPLGLAAIAIPAARRPFRWLLVGWLLIFIASR